MARLSERSDPWVLVTADDKMPDEHRDRVRDLGATLATIDGSWEAFCARHSLELSQEHFKRETVHRWAHVMQEQDDGEVRRYTPLNHAAWKKRRRGD